MPVTPYRQTSFYADEVITKDKMDQLQFNAQWLSENTPRARYTSSRAVDDSLAILSGRVIVPRPKYENIGNARVYFGSTFRPGAQPHVSTGIVSDQKKQVFCTFSGFDALIIPDYRGFDLKTYVTDLSARPIKIKGKTQHDVSDHYIYVQWIAIGLRS